MLPAQIIVFQTQTPVTLTEAIYGFVASLAVNGGSVAPDGEQFLLVFPTAQASRATELLTGKPVHMATASSWIPPSPNLPSVWDLGTVARFYQKLTGKPVEIASGLSRPLARSIRYHAPPSPDEALRSLDLLLGLQGRQVVEQDGGKSLRIVPCTN